MKRVVVFLLLVWVSWAGVGVSLHYGIGEKQDSGFREVYGKGVEFGGIKLDVAVVGGLYLYGGYDYLRSKGRTLIFGEESTTEHQYIGVGIGWESRIKGGVYLRARAGGVYVIYREEALGEEVKSSCLGYEVSGGLRFYLKRIFLEVMGGYLKGSDRVEGVDVKFDGPKAEIGIGVRL